MSIHIGAEQGQIASTVLLPGDPMRAKHFADTMLKDSVCFNQVRGMLGFTGTYGGKRISVMGSGMGIPTLLIYVNEMIHEYGVKTIIRVGTCGSFQPDLKVGDVVLGLAGSTDSQINKLHFGGQDFAPGADFDLLLRAYQVAQEREIPVRVGGVFSTDTFYNEDPEWWKIWADHGVLVCEMETNGLYTLAAKFGVSALSILTVSDNLVTGDSVSSEQREKGFTQMAEIALAAVQ